MPHHFSHVTPNRKDFASKLFDLKCQRIKDAFRSVVPFAQNYDDLCTKMLDLDSYLENYLAKLNFLPDNDVNKKKFCRAIVDIEDASKKVYDKISLLMSTMKNYEEQLENLVDDINDVEDKINKFMRSCTEGMVFLTNRIAIFIPQFNGIDRIARCTRHFLDFARQLSDIASNVEQLRFCFQT